VDSPSRGSRSAASLAQINLSALAVLFTARPAWSAIFALGCREEGFVAKNFHQRFSFLLVRTNRLKPGEPRSPRRKEKGSVRNIHPRRDFVKTLLML